MDDDDIHDLIGAIYEAACAPEKWGPIIRKVREVTESKMGMLWLGNPNISVEEFSTNQGDFLAYEHADLSLADFQEFVRTCQDPSVTEPYAEIAHRVPLGRAVVGHEYVPIDEFKKSEFYHRVAQPVGTVHQLGSIMARRSGRIDTVVFYRESEAPNYDRSDQRLLATLVPHFGRALNLSKRLSTATAEYSLLQSALDALNCAIVLLDRAGQVCFFNAAAERLIKQGCGIRVRRGRLCAMRHADTLALEGLTRRATGADGHRPTGGATVIHQAHPGLSLQVTAAPLPSDNPTMISEHGARALLVIHDPNGQAPVPHEVLERMFGLTPTEKSLLIALSEGQTLRQYSDDHRVTYNTVRTHLRNLFAKTNTSKQSDLVRLANGLGALSGNVVKNGLM